MEDILITDHLLQSWHQALYLPPRTFLSAMRSAADRCRLGAPLSPWSFPLLAPPRGGSSSPSSPSASCPVYAQRGACIQAGLAVIGWCPAVLPAQVAESCLWAATCRASAVDLTVHVHHRHTDNMWLLQRSAQPIGDEDIHNAMQLGMGVSSLCSNAIQHVCWYD